MIHITLTSETRKSAAAKNRALEKIEEITSIARLNQARFERFGIISGDIESEEALTRIRDLEEVQSVQEDQQRFIS